MFITTQQMTWALDDDYWQSAAACSGLDAELFYAAPRERGQTQHKRERQAKAVCKRCPVRQQCLQYALNRAEPHGVWGGMNPDEREALAVADQGVG